jgi:hypothetical protein
VSSFNKVITQAVTDLATHGYSPDRLFYWQRLLRASIPESLITHNRISKSFAVKTAGAIRKNARFTKANIRPQLYAELDRRIMASADLIKLNREAAITKTLQRFSGWSTSIQHTGTDNIDKRTIKAEIIKPLKSLSYQERRVAIDQGHKLLANIEEIIAMDSGALAGIWWDNQTDDPSYDGRPEHVARSGKYFIVRDNWAIKQGVMKKTSNYQYYDEVDPVGQAINCTCTMQWVYSLNKLRPDMLTEKYKNGIL